jgi:dipeptidyl-peptidase-4
MKKVVMIVLLLVVGVDYGRGLRRLSFEQVFLNRGEQLLLPLPRLLGWADDRCYYEVKGGELFKVDVRSGKTRLVLDPSRYPELLKQGFHPLSAVDRSKDYNRLLFLKKGNIFMFDRAANRLRQINDTEEAVRNPTFSVDSRWVAYTMSGDLYAYDTAKQRTIRFSRDGSEEILNGYASWVYYEEIFGRHSRYRAFWWSPDSRKIVFMRFDQSRVPLFPIFHADGIYGRVEMQRYPKAGFPNPDVQIGIADLDSGSVKWIPYRDETDHYLAFPTWDQASSRIYFQWMNRKQNHLKLHVYDLTDHTIRLVYEEEQPTWIEFLGDLGLKDLHVLKNGDVLIKSSKSGWYHIYHVRLQGTVRPVTSGEWSVHQMEWVDEKTKTIHFTAQREDSCERHLYTIDFRGRRLNKLTRFKGSHAVQVSPAGSYFIDWYSAIATPYRVDLRDKSGGIMRELGNSSSPVMKAYQWARAELFRVKTDDGYHLPVLWYLPPDFDPGQKYPVVFTIYGGPGTPSVMNRYRFSPHFLAQQGIIVLSVDHLGSGHFGKKGMDAMYRQLGRREMHDYIQVVEYLRTLPFIDSERIGITGASYGGYLTALALTRGAGYFCCGYADSGVYDWRLYDSTYTERYMDTPAHNPEGYRQSAVHHYIDRFKGTLHLTHGTLDDNGHLQSALQLLDRLQEAGKMVELEIYPGQRHVYRGKKNITHLKSSLNFWLKHFFNQTLKQ